MNKSILKPDTILKTKQNNTTHIFTTSGWWFLMCTGGRHKPLQTLNNYWACCYSQRLHCSHNNFWICVRMHEGFRITCLFSDSFIPELQLHLIIVSRWQCQILTQRNRMVPSQTLICPPNLTAASRNPIASLSHTCDRCDSCAAWFI